MSMVRDLFFPTKYAKGNYILQTGTRVIYQPAQITGEIIVFIVVTDVICYKGF